MRRVDVEAGLGTGAGAVTGSAGVEAVDVGVGADMEAVGANADVGANVDAAVRGPMQVPGADR